MTHVDSFGSGHVHRAPQIQERHVHRDRRQINAQMPHNRCRILLNESSQCAAVRDGAHDPLPVLHHLVPRLLSPAILDLRIE